MLNKIVARKCTPSLSMIHTANPSVDPSRTGHCDCTLSLNIYPANFRILCSYYRQCVTLQFRPQHRYLLTGIIVSN